MKNLQIGFVVIAFILCAGFLKAQDNIGLFADEGTEWSVGNFYPHPQVPMRMFFLKMSGDSLIEGEIFHKIWFSETPFSESETAHIACLVRVSEDSLMILRDNNDLEYIIFDFALDLEETRSLDYYHYTYSNGNEGSFTGTFEASICSFYTENILGHDRRVWGICDPEWTEGIGTEWIEGIGSKTGILWSNFNHEGFVGFYPVLLCAHLDGEQIYQNEDFDFCELYLPTYYDRINLLALDNTVWTNAKFSAPYQLTRKDYLWMYQTTQSDIFDYNYYHIVRRSDEYPPTLENSEIAFYVKMFEDSVLYIKNLENVEYPVFDFKMNPGDNASIYGFDYLTGEFYPLEITIEDTGRIETLSGERKYWDVTSDGYTRWIEGLGNEEGLMYANYALQGFVGETNFMICAFNEGNQLYINSLFSDCLISEIGVYKNDEVFVLEQTNSLITIFSQSPRFRCDVFDLAGRKVFSQETESGDIQFLSNEFNSGLYLIYLNDGKFSKLFKTIIFND